MWSLEGFYFFAAEEDRNSSLLELILWKMLIASLV